MKGKDEFTRFIGFIVGNRDWKQFGSTDDVDTEIFIEACLFKGVCDCLYGSMAIVAELITKELRVHLGKLA